MDSSSHNMDTGSAGTLAGQPLLAQQGVAVLDLRVTPLPHRIAKQLVETHHYLHSMPGGTELCFGVLAAGHLKGVVTFGAGPANAYRIVEGARLEDCLSLTRLWLSDDLPWNSESRVIAQSLRVLRRSTDIKDPAFRPTSTDPYCALLAGVHSVSISRKECREFR